jgi:hypothetical protein
VAIAAIVRVAVWSITSGARFASDEQAYVDAGIALAATGHQDLFFPPMTGWIVALVKTIAPAASLPAIRLLWIAMDLANVALVAILADRVARAVLPDRVSTVVRVSALAYALYLPAVSHAQFVTSEIPALLLVLSALTLVTAEQGGAAAAAGAGAALGGLLLVRANLLPLLVLMPATAFSNRRPAEWLRLTGIVAIVGALIPGAALARNWLMYGEPTLSRNAAYNLYIGNRDAYAEDLNLLHPTATPEQIEFRRQMFAGTLQYPSGTAAEMQNAAVQSILEHPGRFIGRMPGRLARVFAPKTDVLELAGGEAAAGVFSPVSIGLLGVANLQWVIMLFAGVFGIRWLWSCDRRLGTTLIVTIAGAVALCLIAISKPRYSFVFDPLLILGATLIWVAPAGQRAAAWRQSWRILMPIYVFLVWGWMAWIIFAVSSRLTA